MLFVLKHTFRAPHYQVKIVTNHLSDRILEYDTTDGPRKKTITAGDAQSSILGPDFGSLPMMVSFKWQRRKTVSW